MSLTESLCHTVRISIRSNSCVLMIENVAVKEILSSRNEISSRYRALRSNVPSIQGQNFRHPMKFLRAMNLVKIFLRGIPAQIYSSLRQWTRGPIEWGIWCSNCGSLNPLEITTTWNLLFLHAAIFHWSNLADCRYVYTTKQNLLLIVTLLYYITVDTFF